MTEKVKYLYRATFAWPAQEHCALVSVNGVPLEEWKRRQALPVRLLVKEDAPHDNLSERIKRGLQVRIDDLNEWDWIIAETGMEVGTLRDHVIHWYQG